MPFPKPAPGLVISYAYLWHHEYNAGRDEGRKDRPSVIVLTVDHPPDGATFVTVLPITHSAPQNPTSTVEIPIAVKRHLGLDAHRSWIIVTEGNEFLWPGYDLRMISRTSGYEYGFLPPRLFAQVLAAFRAWHSANKATIAPRG